DVPVPQRASAELVRGGCAREQRGLRRTGSDPREGARGEERADREDLPRPLREGPRGGIAAEAEREERSSGEGLRGLEPHVPERSGEVEDRVTALLGQGVEDH